MAGFSITADGAIITDISSHRDQLLAAREKLSRIYAGFNRTQPEALLQREAEIVGLANEAERLREIIKRWDEAEARYANILTVWEIVKQFKGDDA